jgi:hypothetical protein
MEAKVLNRDAGFVSVGQPNGAGPDYEYQPG